MKAIIVDGKIISICEQPYYIKRHPLGHCYINTTAEEAEGISIALGDYAGAYNLPQSPDLLEGRPVAYINDDIDTGEYFYHTYQAADKSVEDIAIIEESMCNSDMEITDRLASIEDCLCDLDAMNNE